MTEGTIKCRKRKDDRLENGSSPDDELQPAATNALKQKSSVSDLICVALCSKLLVTSL